MKLKNNMKKEWMKYKSGNFKIILSDTGSRNPYYSRMIPKGLSNIDGLYKMGILTAPTWGDILNLIDCVLTAEKQNNFNINKKIEYIENLLNEHKNKKQHYNFIILEGVDKSGKTTISNYLLKNIKNSVLIKGNVKPKNSSEEEIKKIRNYYNEILKLIKSDYFKDKTIIIDRYFPSQMIYSIKRKHDEMYNKYYIKFEEEIKKINHLLIYCRPDIDVILSRFDKLGDEYINKDDIYILLKRYDYFFKKTNLNKIIIEDINDKKLIW